MKKRSTQLLAVFALACLLRFALIAAWYTPDLSKFQGGDYTLYKIGATDFSEHSNFENSLFLVRPPGFPLLIDVLGLNDMAVLIANALLGALIAPLTYVFARQCRLGTIASLFAALIVALDPSSVVYSSALGAEALANLTLLITLILLLASLRTPRFRASLMLALIAGIALVLSAYTRPATFVLWIVLGGWAIFAYRKRWLVIAVFVLVSAAGVMAWVVHNGVVFGNYTFSTISVYNLLYYRAASVESHGAHLSIQQTYTELSKEVEGRLGHDTSHVDSGTRQEEYAATAELQPVMISVALEVFTRYPVIYVLTIPIGLYRILGLVDISSRPLMLIGLAWNLLLLLATAAGLLVLLRARQYALFWLLLLICAYFVTGTLVVQTSGIDTRARTMITPLMAVAAVYALQWLISHKPIQRRLPLGRDAQNETP